MKHKQFIINTLIVLSLIGLVLVFNFIDTKKNTSINVENTEYASENEEFIDTIEDKRVVVFEDMTLDELAAKLDKSLKSDLTGTGYYYAKYSIEYEVDPYLAVAISLHETGCNNTCSAQVRECNNVGGQRFKPVCYAGGTYGKYDTLELGIEGFIRNIANNYFKMGMTTADAMQAKYVGTGSTSWAPMVNKYITKIKSA